MNRRLICFLLPFCLLLCSCGQMPSQALAPTPSSEAERIPESPQPSASPEPESSADPVPDLVLPDLDLSGSRRMANELLGNRALIHGETLYCYEFDSDYRPVLGSYRLRDGLPENFRVLADNCVPCGLSLLDGKLYYLNSLADHSVEVLDPDSGRRETLVVGPCADLRIREEGMYYRREDGRLYRCNLRGGDETLMAEEELYYPCPLEDLILFQDDRLGERLCLYRPEDGARLLLTAGPAYGPLIWQGRLYYSGKDGLHSVDLRGEDQRDYPLPAFTGAAELLPGEDGLSVRAICETHNGLMQWSGSTEGSVHTSSQTYRLCDYLGESFRVDAYYMPDGRIRCFYLIGPGGTEHSYLAGIVDGGNP